MSSPTRRSTDRSDANAPIDFSSHVTLVSDVLDALPLGSPPSWRGITYRAVLGAVVRDRVENGTDDLEEGDVTSLSDFVRSAAAAASNAPAEHRDDAFDIVLQGMLADWVDNWNVSDDEGEDDDDKG
jgi:hypothetical protein